VPAEPVRNANEARSSLRRRLLRGLVLAGGTIAAGLLASGIASAAEADQPAPAADEHSLFGGLTSIDGPLIGALDGVAAALADQQLADQQELLIGLPAELRLPGALELPQLPALADPAGNQPGPTWPTDPPTGDHHALGLVAAPPAVAAHASPPPAVRPSARTDLAGAGVTPASAATPEPEPTPAPIQEQPCLPAAPAPAATAGAMSAVEAAAAARPTSSLMHVGTPRRGSTVTVSIADQPGTTPD